LLYYCWLVFKSCASSSLQGQTSDICQARNSHPCDICIRDGTLPSFMHIWLLTEIGDWNCVSSSHQYLQKWLHMFMSIYVHSFCSIYGVPCGKQTLKCSFAFISELRKLVISFKKTVFLLKKKEIKKIFVLFF